MRLPPPSLFRPWFLATAVYLLLVMVVGPFVVPQHPALKIAGGLVIGALLFIVAIQFRPDHLRFGYIVKSLKHIPPRHALFAGGLAVLLIGWGWFAAQWRHQVPVTPPAVTDKVQNAAAAIEAGKKVCRREPEAIWHAARHGKSWKVWPVPAWDRGYDKEPSDNECPALFATVTAATGEASCQICAY